jgi:tetratricopeptide (TPR) repeat protein
MNTSLSPFAEERRVRRRVLGGELLILILLACVAGYVWTAPRRAERALQQASLTELQEAARRNPNDARAHYYLGLRLQQSGQLPAAYDAFAHAAQLDSDDAKSWLATAALASQLYGDQGAFDLLNLFVKRHPENARAHLALAQLYHKNRAHRRAREEAQAAALSAPHLAEAWYLAGLSANSQNLPSEAESALRRAVAEAPKEWRYQVALGDILAQEKQNPEALACYQQAIHLAPNEGIPYLSLGRTQLDTATTPAEIQAAQESLRRSAALQPEIPVTYLLLGRSYIRQERWQEAKAAVESAARLAPTDPDPAYELARIYRHLGETASADRAVQRHRQLRQFAQQKRTLQEKIATFKQEAPRLRLQLARLCAANGDTAEAIQEYRRYLTLTPGDSGAKQELARLEARITGAVPAASAPSPASIATLLSQADALSTQKRYAEAERVYRRVLQQEPRSARACQGLGLTLQAEGKSEPALLFLLSAVKLDPALTPAQFTLSQAYMAMGAPVEARRRMMAVVQREPGNAAYWHLLGMACSGAEPYYAQAEDALRRAAALDSHNVGYLLDLAELQARANRVTEAEATYRQAQNLAPKDSDMLARFGMFLLSNRPDPQRQREAEGLLKRALAADPRDSYVLYALGRLSLDRSDGRQAVGYLQRALATTTQIDTAELWYLLARAYQRIGDRSHAAKALEISRKQREAYQNLQHTQELADKSPQDVKLHLTLARLYAQRGENAKAISMYQTCLQLDSQNAPARQELAALEKRLKASGKMPPMTAFRALIAAAGQAQPGR